MSSTASSSAESKTLGKRAACDRCRNQKLRCVRVQTNSPDPACIRCVRSQLECISSSSKRPGRPRNSTNAQRAEQQKQQEQQQQQRSSIEPMTSSAGDTTSSLDSVDIPPLGNVEDWFINSVLDNEDDIMTWDSVDSGFQMDDAGTAHTISTSSLSTPPEGSALNNLITDPSLSEQFMELHTDGPPGDDHYNDMFHLFGQTHNPNQHNHVANVAPNFDHGLHFSLLQRDLSKQLFALTSMPWDITKVMRLTCGTHDGWTDQPDDQNNPLARIATSSSEFAKLLCSVQTPQTPELNGSGKPKPSPLSSINPRLSTADLLTILSCHMLTVSIYDTIFGHFSDQAAQNPSLVNMVVQSAPKLYLGGIAVPPRIDILGHILCSLVGSHLRPIEMLLGLPDQFCVSTSNSADEGNKQNGLFGGESGQTLFSALMKVEAERSEDRGGLGVIESLKDRIGRIEARPQ